MESMECVGDQKNLNYKTRLRKKKSKSKTALKVVGVGLTVAGAAYAANSLSKSGKTPVKNVTDFPFMASGKDWSVKAQNGETFDLAIKYLVAQKQRS